MQMTKRETTDWSTESTQPTSSSLTTTGKLVAIEGIDGSGTTTVTEELGASHDIVTTREPAEDYWTGRAARQAINDDSTHPMTDLFMFLADRAHHIEHTIEPALDAGHTVVTDRYVHSTYAYQQENIRGVAARPMEFLQQTMEDWVRPPDLVILLDVDPDIAAERSSDGDKYEVSSFQERVRENYRSLAASNINTHVVNAEQPIEYVVSDVEAIMMEHL